MLIKKADSQWYFIDREGEIVYYWELDKSK